MIPRHQAAHVVALARATLGNPLVQLAKDGRSLVIMRAMAACHRHESAERQKELDRNMRLVHDPYVAASRQPPLTRDWWPVIDLIATLEQEQIAAGWPSCEAAVEWLERYEMAQKQKDKQ